ncbi:MAG: YggS family pyridoxal phosphate-dependent enzyme [Desulfosarcinaceae bacterium]|nr:YggS family pyridoxal phosphate-dependent enzyme [Desulfosarcinaceae bacterium]
MANRLQQIRDRIAEAALSVGRTSDSVRLVAVSKTMPAERVRDAIQAGVTILGENYIQEAREKFNALYDLGASWHFIGHLQSNKAKYAVRIFDLIHSVDSLKLATVINKEAAKRDKIQEILIQVNLSGEATKSGLSADGVAPLLDAIGGLTHIRIRGLMTMPPFFDDPDRARPFFEELSALRDRLGRQPTANADLTELSMGMTGDFEVAIAAGATLVRIGTAIFGERHYP